MSSVIDISTEHLTQLHSRREFEKNKYDSLRMRYYAHKKSKRKGKKSFRHYLFFMDVTFILKWLRQFLTSKSVVIPFVRYADNSRLLWI